MAPNEQLEAWRSEIEAELQELQAQLAQTEADFNTAQTARAAALADVQALDALMAAGQDRHGTHGVLMDRLAAARDDALRPHSDVMGIANGRIKFLRARIEGRKDALQQIARALASAKYDLVVEGGS